MTDVIAMLEKDHKQVRDLIKKIKSSGDSAEATRRDLLTEITNELNLHTSFEEEVFYPAARKATGMDDEVNDDLEEHREADALLDELAQLRPTTKQFMETVETLEKALDHHIHDEEDELFPAARKQIGKDELEAMANTYAQRKDAKEAA